MFWLLADRIWFMNFILGFGVSVKGQKYLPDERSGNWIRAIIYCQTRLTLAFLITSFVMKSVSIQTLRSTLRRNETSCVIDSLKSTNKANPRVIGSQGMTGIEANVKPLLFGSKNAVAILKIHCF